MSQTHLPAGQVALKVPDLSPVRSTPWGPLGPGAILAGVALADNGGRGAGDWAEWVPDGGTPASSLVL